MKTMSGMVFGLLLILTFFAPRMASALSSDSLFIAPDCGDPDPTWVFSFLNEHQQFVNEIVFTIDPTDSIGFEGANTFGSAGIWDSYSDSLGDSLIFSPLNGGGGLPSGTIDSGFYFELGGLGGSQFPLNKFNHAVTITWQTFSGGQFVNQGNLVLTPELYQGCLPDSDCLSPLNEGVGVFPDGTTGTKLLNIENWTTGKVILDSIDVVSGDVGQFQIDNSQFPITLQPDSSGMFNVSFSVPDTAAAGEKYSAGIVIYSSGKSLTGTPCSVMTGSIWEKASVPVADTIILKAPPGGENTISLAIDRPVSRHAIWIRNDTSIWIQALTLQIDDTSNDAYFDSISNYGTVGTKFINLYFDTILPGMNSYNSWIMTLDAPDTGTYDINLSLDYEIQRAFHKTEITSQPEYQYHIVAHRVPSSAASVDQQVPAVADFSINPNPANGNVTISVPPDINSTIEIYDVLGNLILSKQVNGSFVWSGENSNGRSISDGAYIVRVREVTTNGQILTTSKQLMYAH
jgi:hypothetical protein